MLFPRFFTISMARTFQVVEPGDPAWRSAYDQFAPDDRDVFYDPDFARVCALTIHQDDHVAAALYSQGDIDILYPFVRRDVSDVIGHSNLGAGRRDIVSLYGRGGALCAAGAAVNSTEFHDCFAEWCRSQKIICAFDRFHPVLENHRLAPNTAEVFEVGEFVVVDLRPEMKAVEANFRYSMRKAIRKGVESGVVVEMREDIKHLETFMDIYHETLDRNGAREFYYFPEAFYPSMAKEMPGRFAFYYGVVDGEIVTCELVLFSDRFAHSYLGGTRKSGFAASANQILKLEIMRDLKRRGCEYFLLGGGQSRDDGVFRYKLAYAPDGARRSFVGGTVFLPEDYATLREELRAADFPVMADRFQFYDAG